MFYVRPFSMYLEVRWRWESIRKNNICSTLRYTEERTLCCFSTFLLELLCVYFLTLSPVTCCLFDVIKININITHDIVCLTSVVTWSISFTPPFRSSLLWPHLPTLAVYESLDASGVRIVYIWGKCVTSQTIRVLALNGVVSSTYHYDKHIRDPLCSTIIYHHE